MPLIAVAGTKGGQGKTIWACAMAALLNAELLDANPENGDAEAWARLAGHPCRSIYPDNLGELEDAAGANPWTVMDCPPWDGTETRTALAYARAVLVPVASGYQDLRGLARTATLIRKAKEMANPSLKTFVLGNGRRAVGFTRAWEEALSSYHDPRGAFFYLGSIPQRQGIVEAFGAGLPAYLAAGPAAQEAKVVLNKMVILLKTR